MTHVPQTRRQTQRNTDAGMSTPFRLLERVVASRLWDCLQTFDKFADLIGLQAVRSVLRACCPACTNSQSTPDTQFHHRVDTLRAHLWIRDLDELFSVVRIGNGFTLAWQMPVAVD